MKKIKGLPTFLFVLPWSLEHVGGVNNVVVNLAREVRTSLKFVPIVLIVDWNATSPIWGESHGITTVRWRIRSPTDGGGVSGLLVYYLQIKRFSLEFEKFCEVNDVEVINIHYPGPHSFFISRFIRQSKRSIRLVLSFHGSDVTGIGLLSSFSRYRWRQILKSNAIVVACSEDLGIRLDSLFGNTVDRHIIYNGIDVDSFVDSASTGVTFTHRIILSVGKFVHLKGQDVLIEAFASIAHLYNDVKLVFVGASGESLPALQSMAKLKLGDDRVEFLTEVPHMDIATQYKSASMFVLPSRQEAFGIVLLEAAAFGLPVVASSVGGIPELLNSSDVGLLVDSDDPSGLAACIQKLLDNPEAAIVMGERLRERVRNQFTWGLAATRYIELVKFAEVIDGQLPIQES